MSAGKVEKAARRVEHAPARSAVPALMHYHFIVAEISGRSHRAEGFFEFT
jgi:hypothetical protein